ncbi:early nodulin-93-like [Phoenix dactylifera]|uniref:Early nodulin-93-like n=1 Tax=Phoenix dactylifera TaxID=42345 RepID=A0A8B9ADI8_PHODC|nr:early nodulin-93-like [Phoenix dactylifera]
MGVPSELRDAWASRRKPSAIASPNEPTALHSKSSVREAVRSGIKTALITGSVAAVPTLVGCRVIPWAKANLNYTAQALIISSASIAGFFIAADQTILESARENSFQKYDKTT